MLASSKMIRTKKQESEVSLWNKEVLLKPRNNALYDLQRTIKINMRKHILCLVAVICPAVIAVILLASIGMFNARINIETVNDLNENVRIAEAGRKVLSKIRKERGVTCIASSLKHSSPGLIERAHLETDQYLDLLFEKKREMVQKRLLDIRQRRTTVTCIDAITEYTLLTNELMAHFAKDFYQTSEGKFYSLVKNFESIIYANDLIGVNRAMGGSFLMNGKVDTETWTEYAGPDPKHAYMWFDYMTKYIEHIDRIESEISNGLHDELSLIVSENDHKFWTQVFILVTICTICPILATVYILHTGTLIRQSNKVSLQVLDRGKEIENQRQRTELFLNRITLITQKLCSQCRCETMDKMSANELQAEIMNEMWEFHGKGSRFVK